jgi:ribonuclease VapC
VTLVIDSSALVAIAYREPESDHFASMIERADEAVCSAVTLYEAGVVIMRNRPAAQFEQILELTVRLGVKIEPFTYEHMLLALDAYRRYGKGMGRRPYLNFGDCVSYAVAKSLDAPLLFKGDDFSATDVRTE